MSKALLIGPENLLGCLREEGLIVTVLNDPQNLDSLGQEELPDVVLLDTASVSSSEQREYIEECHRLRLPVIGLVPEDKLDQYDFTLGVDDFLVLPAKAGELVARVQQTTWRFRGGATSKNTLTVGDLVVDLDRYEVSVAGHKALLTYKEYELLRLLATNPGRVYTREALLSKVWGYDYFGGTRTVDVHIRRLRSKIEDADHSFIETIWNVGYRFRDPSGHRPGGQ